MVNGVIRNYVAIQKSHLPWTMHQGQLKFLDLMKNFCDSQMLYSRGQESAIDISAFELFMPLTIVDYIDVPCLHFYYRYRLRGFRHVHSPKSGPWSKASIHIHTIHIHSASGTYAHSLVLVSHSFDIAVCICSLRASEKYPAIPFKTFSTIPVSIRKRLSYCHNDSEFLSVCLWRRMKGSIMLNINLIFIWIEHWTIFACFVCFVLH